MKISLVMATYGRYEEIDLLLKSLVNQTYKNYELIIVDQNDEINLKPLLELYSDRIDLKHITGEKGLSKSRNVGLKYTSGDIIGFPDDDCVYSVNVLEKVCSTFADEGVKGVVGESVAEFSDIPKQVNLKKLNKYSVWFHGISYTIFLHSEAVNSVGLFDVKLGVGSGTIYGSGEETDYLIRTIENGYSLFYDNTLEIIHPVIDITAGESSEKAYNYSVGRMYVLRKHNYDKFFVLLNIIYPIVKLLLNILKPKKIKYFWYQFLGRVVKDRDVK